MLVENGRVLERGSEVAGEAQIVDLKDKWVMPSFIDNHCHILPTGLDLQKLHLGACSSHGEVLQKLDEALPHVDAGRWLMAVHYDQTKYEGVHLTRHDLDKISTSTPILLRHVNGHASVANTAALQAANIADDQADPEGGTFRKDSSGFIDGVLLESAHERVTAACPIPTLEEKVKAIIDAGQKMAELGISCATDMMTGRFNLMEELQAYHYAARLGNPIRVRLYLQWAAVFGPRAIAPDELAEIRKLDNDLCRITGIKIFADGAIGSATAAIYGRYTGETAIGPVLSRRMHQLEAEEVSGSLMYSPAKLREMVLVAHEDGYQVATHSIGDYSTDLVMDAYEATGEPSRHRIEHAMIMSDAQIERFASLGCFCSMQPEFLMRFGHSYLRQLGPERASKLNRAKSFIDAGVPLSFSSDRPIVAGDPRDGIRTATSRPSVFDQGENVTAKQAWLAYTTEGARANGDSDIGELLPGQLADFQILDEAPLLQR